MFKGAASEAGDAAEGALSEAEDSAASEAESVGGCALSFVSSTLVATKQGEQAIGTLEVGEQVWAYHPRTKQMELEPIQHIWLNHDHDLIDLTLTTRIKGPQGKTIQKAEVIHTNQKHPFLTQEKGFIPVSQLQPGMHVLAATGEYGLVVRVEIVPGALWMYNLTVAQDHTYVVGVGQWIVHNTGLSPCGGGESTEPEYAFLPKNRYPQTAAHIQDLEGSVTETGHWDPAWSDYNREGSLEGYPTIPGLDRDEWPMAASQEGGPGADIRYIDPSDNRGAHLERGAPFRIEIVDEWLF